MGVAHGVLPGAWNGRGGDPGSAWDIVVITDLGESRSGFRGACAVFFMNHTGSREQETEVRCEEASTCEGFVRPRE
ncbi:hypothetical protein HRbin28_01427 [bacterium HR28]|nr:hypothetical protein HRbin28_01427 [bacterium HR28]